MRTEGLHVRPDAPPVLADIRREDWPRSSSDARRDMSVRATLRRGRGAVSNVSGRFEAQNRVVFDDGWGTLDDDTALRTEVVVENPKRIITRNTSPDIGFDRSINPYRGCEHGCTYCFARPNHAFVGLSPGLDFETKLFAKTDAHERLLEELAAKSYRPATIALGTSTDPYQPIERHYRITRRILEVLAEANHPVAIVTKSGLITRDIDILGPMADKGLVKVAISLTTLDNRLSRSLEPRAAAPAKRLATMKSLSEAGIPVAVLTAPIIPAINDMEIERLLDAAHGAGAREAGYVLLRLPLEVADLFKEWLMEHRPDSYDHVMGLLRDMRGGADYQAAWGERMTGRGPYAWMIGRRFEIAAKRLGLNERRLTLRTDLFRAPVDEAGQMALI